VTSDKKISQLPETLSDEPYVETSFDDGSMQFDFGEEAVEDFTRELKGEGAININDVFYKNLADDIEDEQFLNEIGGEVLDRFEEDKNSRAEHINTIRQGLTLLGTDLEESDDPFPGACAAHHPLILEAAVKFQAKAANELFNAKGPVKTQVIGKLTPEKEKQAERVRNHMNFQVMHQMEEFFDETEQLLFDLPIMGSAFKKLYYCPILDRPKSVYVPIDNFVVNYYATSLKTASCYTHIIELTMNELRKEMISGFYRDVDLVTPSATIDTEVSDAKDMIMGYSEPADDQAITILEQYCYLDLEDEDPHSDKDGILLPYIVTVEAATGKVLSIRRNWNEGDEHRVPLCPFTQYKFVPGMGFYGLGYIHLLGNLQMSLTSAMRSLLDSGAFANLQGGFVDKRLRVRDNDGPIAPGEFREVEAGGLDLKNAFFPLPFKEPSQVLLQMYQFVEQRSQKFADSTEQVVSDSSNYGPVGTTMALLEASTKFFSGVHKRLHKAQRNEFKILANINYEYLGESEEFDTVGATYEIRKEDYDGRIDVIPVSDPNLGSQSQKLAQATAVNTTLGQYPAEHNRKAVLKYYYGAIGIDDEIIEQFLPQQPEPQPLDPISDLLAAQQGQPIKAFEGQDHQSHIQVKSAFLQDPKGGASPAMATLVPVIQSNIQEHTILMFKQNVQGTAQQAGVDPQQAQSEQVQAMAAQRVAQTNARMAELEQQSPDEARNKLADAEVMRVVNESRKLEQEVINQQAQRTFEAMKLELEKYKIDMDSMKTQLQEENKAQQTQLKEMSGLLKEALKLQDAAEARKEQRKTLTLNNNDGTNTQDSPKGD
jgi:hypothetical protein